jgi:hypothetical protein
VGDAHAILGSDGRLKVFADRASFCADPDSGVAAQRAFWAGITGPSSCD